MAHFIKTAEGRQSLMLTTEEWIGQGVANGWMRESDLLQFKKFAQEEIERSESVAEYISMIDAEMTIMAFLENYDVLIKTAQNAGLDQVNINALKRMGFTRKQDIDAAMSLIREMKGNVNPATGKPFTNPQIMQELKAQSPSAGMPSKATRQPKNTAKGIATKLLEPAAAPAAAPKTAPARGKGGRFVSKTTPTAVPPAAATPAAATPATPAAAPAAAGKASNMVKVINPRTGQPMTMTPESMARSMQSNRFGDAARVNAQRLQQLPPSQRQAFMRQLAAQPGGKEILNQMRSLGTPQGAMGMSQGGGFVQKIDPTTGKPISQIGNIGSKIKGMPGQLAGQFSKAMPQTAQNIGTATNAVKSIPGAAARGLAVGPKIPFTAGKVGLVGAAAGLGGGYLGHKAYQYFKNREAQNQKINPQYMVNPAMAQKAFMASSQIKNLNSMRGSLSSIDSGLDRINGIMAAAISKIQQGAAGQNLIQGYNASQQQQQGGATQ